LIINYCIVVIVIIIIAYDIYMDIRIYACYISMGIRTYLYVNPRTHFACDTSNGEPAISPRYLYFNLR